ncbi:VirD2 family relaxase/mobilization nuclease [Mesorhizobium sp. WSM4313]|uniref:relaxase/mobilization nuclease domain-containing protein n=1 Tax=Mesorhizobium sp. WSM4313 TaxID=2029412 RepID=UPI000BB01E5B|nr:VirD2 family relaxase/mobilization nuclease [Mesorhizobium sp. WSM4313]PBB17371.1 type VI secretion protein [Mesorhizobium sp. WSM4313]
MSDEHEFRIRPGRIRSTRAQSSRPFIAQALAAAQKAGGGVSRAGRIETGSRRQFGRGRAASLQANRFLTGRSRLATIKTRVVRHSKRTAPLATHLNYLRREGVTRDDARARMFGPEVDDASTTDFIDRCKDDRHHFRFIVSPEDAAELADLKSFTRDLMGRMQKDLGTSLDWIAVDHWNTDNPHVHVILRGRADDGQDLVISRDYISRGMRDRASELVTQELGPRSDLEIRRHVERQVEAERWTGLDRQLLRDAGEDGIIDLAPRADRQPDEFIAPKIGRLHRLETLGLAEQLGPGQWIVSGRAEATLRQMGERADIIKRMHRAFSARDIERASASYVLAAESIGETISGRLIERGLDDELSGSAYAVIDGVDGRCHHVRLADLEAAGDGAPGAIVELRTFEDAQGRRRLALAVRSDLDIDRQVVAEGATWLDRQALARPAALSDGGFGAEVRQALDRRVEHLIGLGLAERQPGGTVFAGNLIDTLRRKELDALGGWIATQTGRSFNRAASGELVSGTYSQRFALASGRFAMIDDGLGFQLVPWTPSLEKHLGQRVSGSTRGDGGVGWSFARKRGLGL